MEKPIELFPKEQGREYHPPPRGGLFQKRRWHMPTSLLKQSSPGWRMIFPVRFFQA